MIIIGLWTLFALLIVGIFVAIVAAAVGFQDRGWDDKKSLAARLVWPLVAFVILGVAALPIVAWGASYLYAEGQCDRRGGEFVTWANSAGWDCLLPEDFGPLSYDQNLRIDLGDD